MFNKVKVPVSSIIENMSYFQPPNSDEKYHIFGKGRLIPTAKEFDIPLWYELPINEKISSYNNKKTPYLFNSDQIEMDQYKKIINDIVWTQTLQNSEDSLTIDHNNNDQQLNIQFKDLSTTLSYKSLRLDCQCAFCVDEMTRKKLIKDSDIDPKITIKSIYKVGHYAYGIDWLEHNKTHQSMYTLDFLKTKLSSTTDSASK